MLHFDRVGSPWLMKRFIDPKAELFFEAKGQSNKRPKGAIHELAGIDAATFLSKMPGGRVADPQHFSLGSWLNHLVSPLLIQASFTGPIYDGNCNRVFWKLFGEVR